MPIVTRDLIGRLGNNLFQYAHARAYAEQQGCELQTNKWIGQEIFQGVNEPPISAILPERNDTNLEDAPVNVRLTGYAQHQGALIYTREQARKWFTLKPELQKLLLHQTPIYQCLGHLRRGDYHGAGYPTISKQSYIDAAEDAGFPIIRFISEETQVVIPGTPPFLMDFYAMMICGTLFRANSSFSWWAAVLGSCNVYSPITTGLEPGKEHDKVPFVIGNWPRLHILDFTTDLILKP